MSSPGSNNCSSTIAEMVAAFKLWLLNLFTTSGGRSGAVPERRVYKPLEHMSLRQDGDFTNPLMVCSSFI